MVERANALGGALTVSDPGKGCRVAVRLPLYPASGSVPVRARTRADLPWST